MLLLMMFFTLFFLSVYVSRMTLGAYCSGKPQDGDRVSAYPILLDNHLELIRVVKNGKLYHTGPDTARFPVVHVWGSNAYEMGLAQGQLLGPVLREFVERSWIYLKSNAVQAMTDDRVPLWAKSLIAEHGMERALDWTIEKTANYTPASYVDELKGIADGSGVDYDKLYRLNMFPELTKAQCSFFGAWGTAVR